MRSSHLDDLVGKFQESKVIAELGIHQGLVSCKPAFFKILCPQEFLVNTIAKQLFTDILVIRLFAGRIDLLLILLRKEDAFQHLIGVMIRQRP